MLEVNQSEAISSKEAPGPNKTKESRATPSQAPLTPSIRLVGDHLRIHIPMRFKKKSGRKEIILPEGYRAVTADPQQNPAVQKPLAIAVALGHRWLDYLTEGKFLSVQELADEIGIDPSLLRRHLNLTCLPPKLVLAILDGKEPDGMSLEGMKEGMGGVW